MHAKLFKKRQQFVTVKGVLFTVYSVGYMAAYSQRSPVWWRINERVGIVPPPIIGRIGHVRYYTASEILAYARLIKQSESYRWWPKSKGPKPAQQQLAWLKNALWVEYTQLKKAFLNTPETMIRELKTTASNESGK